MNIIFLCLGTRGDVQPYVAIGRTAVEHGHAVTVCTGKTFQSLVEQNGLTFRECSLDLMAILQTEEGKQVFEEGLRHPLKAVRYAKQVINPLYHTAMTEFYKASSEMDVIIFHPKAFGAVDIAEKLGILAVSMPPVPIIYPVSAFPNLAITTKNLGRTLNKLSYTLTNIGAESNNIHDINTFREKELGLPKRKQGIYMTRRNDGPLPIIYPVSRSLFLDTKEFEKEVYLSGFPMLEDKSELDPEVKEFLQDPKVPVVVTFSSMPLKDPQTFLKKITSALEATGSRGIIITGNSGIKRESDHQILFREYLPHDLIFQKAKGILHHGGVGTTAAALRSGKPQVIMPFQVDQPFWAKRLSYLGYALEPLKEGDPQDAFAARFKQMDQENIILKAEKIATELKQENANKNAVHHIEQLYKEWTSSHG